MWDFVVPEDEAEEPNIVASTSSKTVEYRPNRMALGCSSEMIQEKISENAKRSRLEKLLKRRGELDDGNDPTSTKISKQVIESDESRSNIISRKVLAHDPLEDMKRAAVVHKNGHGDEQLSKSQKKRQKKKLKDLQKKLVH
jgi:hypothetical protein